MTHLKENLNVHSISCNNLKILVNQLRNALNVSKISHHLMHSNHPRKQTMFCIILFVTLNPKNAIIKNFDQWSLFIHYILKPMTRIEPVTKQRFKQQKD